MKNQNSNKFLALLTWLLPSGSELAIMSALVVLTLAASNATAFRDFIFLPNNFEIKSAVLDSLNNLVVHFVGDHIARSAVVAIFWALVGLLVYVGIWLLLNFSSEFGNDLATTKYMHPRNVDTRSPLRNFVSKVSFQFVALFLFIFYANFTISVLLPYCGGLFRTAIKHWPSSTTARYGLMAFFIELFVLHFFVILIRALVLRKRVFG